MRAVREGDGASGGEAQGDGKATTVEANSLWGNNIASGLMFLVFMTIFHIIICMSFNRILGGRSC